MDGETCQPMTRDVAPLQFRAAVKPGSVNDENRTAEMVWTTGARVLRGLFDKFYEELSLDPAHVRMARLNSGAPLLDTHSSYGVDSVLGVVESARLVGKKGTAIVRFAKAEDDPEAEKAFRKVKDGILKNVSVGYRVYKYEITEKTGEFPVYRAIDWEPFEVSIVPMGADEGVGFRSEEASKPNPCIFTHSKETRTMADPIIPEVQKPAATLAADPTEQLVAQARAENQKSTAATAEQVRQAAVQAVDLERQRITEITKLAKMTPLGEALGERLIKANTPLDEARKIVLEEIRRNSDSIQTDGHVRFEAGDDVRDKFVRGGCAAIYQRYGQAQTIVAAMRNPNFADHFRGVSVDPGEFSGWRPRDLARRALELRGVAIRHLTDDQIVKKALTLRDAGQQGVADFPILFEVAAHKIFLGRYEQTPVTWRRWCGVRPLDDFQTATFYRPGSFNTLDAVTENGEIKHKNIPDGEKSTLTPSTKGCIVGLSRKSIVNDQMGVFVDTIGGLGDAAANTIEAACYALLTAQSGLGANFPGDTHPLFYSTRSNIGTTGAMSVATIDSARTTMAKQKDPSGNVFLNMRPSVWVGPIELEGQMMVFNESATEPTASVPSGVPNRVRGLVKDIVGSPYLSAQSATRHYFFADPSRYAVVAVGFVNGQEAPQVTQYQTEEYDGIRIRILHDHGEAIMDYKGSVTCAGS